MGITNLIEVFCNLNFHIVADALVFFYAGVEFDELVIIVFSHEFLNHSEHALYALRETCNLLLCFEHRELWSFHDASLNETQTEVVFVFVCFRLDDEGYEFLNLWNEPH